MRSPPARPVRAGDRRAARRGVRARRRRRGRSRREELASPADRAASATARSATARCSRRGRDVPPDDDGATCRARASTPRSPASSGRPTSSSRSTCARPTPTGTSRCAIELRRLGARRPGRDRGDRARAYPTPWSRSMFAGELAKPSSICLGAFEHGEERLVGYLVVSRYVDAWHVMNVAVDPDHRGRGDRDAAARAPLRADRGRRAPRLHARGARLERDGDPPLRGLGFAPAASAAATTPTTARTR